MKKILTICSMFVLMIALTFSLVACGEENFTVTFDANKPTGVTAAVENMPANITEVTKDSVLTALTTEPTLAGYTFGGWYKEAACTTAWTFATDKVAADITLYAKWTENTPVPTAVAFSGLTAADGTAYAVSTTQLTLTFDIEPVGLTIANVTVDGATKDTLTGTGLTRTLTISAITVDDGASITVTLTSPEGFTITPASRTAAVHVKSAEIALNWISCNGTNKTQTTTYIGLRFNSTLPDDFGDAHVTVTGANIDGSVRFDTWDKTNDMLVIDIIDFAGNGATVNVKVSYVTADVFISVDEDITVYYKLEEITVDSFDAWGTDMCGANQAEIYLYFNKALPAGLDITHISVKLKYLYQGTVNSFFVTVDDDILTISLTDVVFADSNARLIVEIAYEDGYCSIDVTEEFYFIDGVYTVE